MDFTKLGQYLPFTGGFNNMRTGGVQPVPGSEQGGSGKTGGTTGTSGIDAVWGGDQYGNINVNSATYNRISAINGELSPDVSGSSLRHLAWA